MFAKSSASRMDDFPRKLGKELTSPSSRARAEKDANTPVIFANSKLGNIPKFIEKPYIYRYRSQRKKQRIDKSSKNNICSELELMTDKQHPTIQLAFQLYNSSIEESKGLKKRPSKAWKPKSPHELLNDHFLKNQAHLLGLTESELKSRVDFLCNIGLDKSDSLTVALHFPSSLHLNTNEVKVLAKLYAAYKVNLTKVFTMYPFIFGLKLEDVSKRLNYLATTGLKKKEIGNLINSNPIILCFDLNAPSKDSVQFCSDLSNWKSSAGKSLFIEAILKNSLSERAVKYEFNEMFESIASFLEQLKVPVSNVFKQCPEFFSTPMDLIYRVMHYLTDSPFFFDVEALSKFIHKHPDIYLQLDKEEVKSKIQRIYDILGDESELFEIMQATPKMFVYSQCVENRIHLFLKWKFTAKHIAQLMKKFPLFFYDNRVVENLDERLEFLLGANNLQVSQIMKFPSCLQLRIAVLVCRIGYVQSFKPDVLQGVNLQKLFSAKDKEFAVDICSTTLETFYQYVDENFSPVEVKLIKKKGANKEKNC
eukprot:gene7080-7877_t